MGGVRVTPARTAGQEPPRWGREARARAGYYLGVVLIALGVGWQLGPGWGVAVLGAGVVAGFVWLYNVDDPAGPADQEDGGGPW